MQSLLKLAVSYITTGHHETIQNTPVTNESSPSKQYTPDIKVLQNHYHNFTTHSSLVKQTKLQQV